VKASHTLNRLCPAFDDPNLVANAGLILPVTLAHRLGLPELLRTIDLGPVPGRPNPIPFSASSVTRVRSDRCG
jgi:hypothetical protein